MRTTMKTVYANASVSVETHRLLKIIGAMMGEQLKDVVARLAKAEATRLGYPINGNHA